MAGAKLPKWGFCGHKTPGQRLADCGKLTFNTSHLEDLGAQVRAGDESFEFAHDAESLSRAAVWNLRCDYGDFDLCFEPAGVAGGYDELAQDAHTVLIEVDGEVLPVRCADLAVIVRSKAAANRAKDRQVLALLVAQLEEREAQRRRGDRRRGGDRGIGL